MDKLLAIAEAVIHEIKMRNICSLLLAESIDELLEIEAGIDAETIANMADRGEKVSQYFNKPVRKAPLIESQRVNVDFPIPVLDILPPPKISTC